VRFPGPVVVCQSQFAARIQAQIVLSKRHALVRQADLDRRGLAAEFSEHSEAFMQFLRASGSAPA
jgi:hypothetical protein